MTLPQMHHYSPDHQTKVLACCRFCFWCFCSCCDTSCSIQTSLTINHPLDSEAFKYIYPLPSQCFYIDLQSSSPYRIVIVVAIGVSLVPSLNTSTICSIRALVAALVFLNFCPRYISTVATWTEISSSMLSSVIQKWLL